MTRAQLAAAVLLVALAAPARADFEPRTIYKVGTGAGPVEGRADAPVTIVGWSDYSCGYCVRVQGALESLVRLYPDQLRFVHRILPLDDDNTIAAEAALAAAAQGAFDPMNDRLYAVFGRVDRTGVELIARELGLDMVKFRADLDTRAYRPQIAADMADAVALGVAATPTFFINGRAVSGSRPLKTFVDVIDEELARARSAPGATYEQLVADGKSTGEPPGERGDNQPFELDPAKAYRMGLGLPGHQLGPDSALVTIVAWGDFQCPYCAKMAPVLAATQQHYGERVRVVYRHLAMSFHKRAALAAEASVAAAAQGKFWPFHDLVYAQFGRLTRADLEYFAGEAKLDLAAFRAALDDRRYHDAVMAESAAAEAFGVDGTPTVFVNGKPVSGTRSVAQMRALVDAELVAAQQSARAGVTGADVYALVMSGAEGEDRADPSRVPDVAGMAVSPRADDRARSVTAACRLRDAARAATLAAGLAGPARGRAARACAAVGIPLAP